MNYIVINITILRLLFFVNRVRSFLNNNCLFIIYNLKKYFFNFYFKFKVNKLFLH